MKMTGERFIPNRMQALAEIEHMHRYYAIKDILGGKTVLDAACGTGYGSSIISSTAKTVYGIDISEEAIAYAEENYGSESVMFVQGSIDTLPFPDNMFDSVVSFETIEHVDGLTQERFLDEIYRVLKPEGFLIMSTPDKKIYTDESSGKTTDWHVKEFYAEEFQEFISKKFHYTKWYQQYLGEVSLIVNSKDDIMKKHHYDDLKEGKFIIGIASEQPLLDEISISSSYYCPDDFSQLNNFIQIYYRNGLEVFSEEKYQMKEIDTRKRHIKERLWLDGEKVSSLRIDPLNSNGKIELVEIVIGLLSGSEKKIDQVTTNADVCTDKKYTFYHKDPQIIVDLDEEQDIVYVDIEFIIDEVNIDIYPLYQTLKQEESYTKNTLTESIQTYRDQLLFEKGKYSRLVEETDHKEIKIHQLSDMNKEILESRAILRKENEYLEKQLNEYKLSLQQCKTDLNQCQLQLQKCQEKLSEIFSMPVWKIISKFRRE